MNLATSKVEILMSLLTFGAAVFTWQLPEAKFKRERFLA